MQERFNGKILIQVCKKHAKWKVSRNDGSTKEFYETFWDELKEIFVDSVREAKEIEHLSTFQRQAIIESIGKKDRDKRFIKNWWPVSLLNVDSKIISKAVSEKLKQVLPDLIFSQQTAYVKNRNIGESENLISDEIEITEVKDIEDFFVTVDIEKAFDLLDHDFLVSSLEKYGFAQNFILWVNILLKDQESWVINGGKTTKYFLLGRGTH